ncbi:Plant transposon protein [Fragilaria crotonensis]|nr:Plant transposon protein [Fragilaria crotonensis]
MSSATHDDFHEQHQEEGSIRSLFPDVPVGDDDDSDIDCQVVDNTLRMILLQQVEEEPSLGVNSSVVDGGEEEQSSNNTDAPTRKKRRSKRTAMWTDQDGRRRPILPRQTFWYSVYVAAPDLENPQFHTLFRLRFRLPYAQFRELNDRLETEASFSRWHDGKINPWSRVQSTPISLLLLTSLRYLGRGWTFDDLSENTSISEETIRVFFHTFIDFGSTILYRQYVRSPTNCQEARTHTAEYEMAGFPGAIGSTDATHIMLERVSYRLRQTHIGFKMSHTARTYNITVNHRRQILATTSGHPARWNDKTLALFDNFMTDLKDGIIMQDMHFDLYESTAAAGGADESGGNIPNIVKTRRYQGAWLLVDNGYLAWPTTVPPIKTTSSRTEIRFSSWLESMRKDVECTFGILKGRWRILKTGIRLNGVECADKIFLTCCALHNWLLETDGFATTWNNGVSTVDSEWDGPLGEHSPEDDCVIPQAIRNLHNPVAMRTYDLSGMGPGSDTFPDTIACADGTAVLDDNTSDNQEHSNDDVLIAEQADVPVGVRNLSLVEFRKRLITHFDIAYHRRQIKWPRSRSTRVPEPSY